MEQNRPPEKNHPSAEDRLDSPPDVSRRRFLGTLTGALAAGLVVQILGCTTEELGGPEVAGPAGGCPQPGLGKAAATANRTASSISSNHGHTAVLSAATQDAHAAYTLNIAGTAGHDHLVQLTAREVCDLKAGLALTKNSSNVNGHTHTVTFAVVNSPTSSRSGDVGDNHGHTAVVTGVIQDGGAAYNLHIEGSAGHDHVLQLTAAEVATLKAGGTVSGSTVSDGTGHTHSVTFAGVTAIRRDC